MQKRQADGDNKDQASKFIEAARELGCDEREEAFERAVRKVASAKPEPVSPVKGRRGKKVDKVVKEVSSD